MCRARSSRRGRSRGWARSVGSFCRQEFGGTLRGGLGETSAELGSGLDEAGDGVEGKSLLFGESDPGSTVGSCEEVLSTWLIGALTPGGRLSLLNRPAAENLSEGSILFILGSRSVKAIDHDFRGCGWSVEDPFSFASVLRRASRAGEPCTRNPLGEPYTATDGDELSLTRPATRHSLALRNRQNRARRRTGAVVPRVGGATRRAFDNP